MGQNSVFSWELWANSNVQSWNLSPGWDKKPKRESQRGWVSTSTGKQLLGQNKEHLTGSLHLELGGRHLVTSTLKSTTSAFSPGACRAGVPFLQGKVYFSVLPFSPNSLFWSGKWKLERCSSQLWKCSSQCSITCICQSCSQQLKQRGSITFAMATTPCTLVKLHLTSFPLVILSWNCPSHGQKDCNSHSEFHLYGQKSKAQPAQPLRQCKLLKLKHLQCLYLDK